MLVPLSTATLKQIKWNRPTEVECIIATVLDEAEGEPVEGRRAVYDVILERMKRQQKDACTVVLQPKQFSGMSEAQLTDIDQNMLDNYWKIVYSVPVSCQGCTHFHRVDVFPEWRKKMKFVKRINKHAFYKEMI